MAYRDSFSFGYSLTPWVKRLILANVIVFLVTWIAGRLGMPIGDLLALRPDAVLTRPWTILTYMFVHAGFLHILFNMIALFFFGPPVEERLGSNDFIKFYLVCGLGGAALSFLLQIFTGPSLIVGASGAIYGVMLAYAMYWPDAPIYIWGILPVKAKWMLAAFVALDLLGALGYGGAGVAHFAHLGGLGAGFLYLKSAGLQVAIATRAKKLFRPRLTVIPGSAGTGPAKPGRRAHAEQERILDDLDRVLDKISRSGMASLTPDERKLLDDASKRFRQN
ncbi:MAG TPA: rhomboid family intramembrane serine protease [Longimicrobiales bacterium]